MSVSFSEIWFTITFAHRIDDSSLLSNDGRQTCRMVGGFLLASIVRGMIDSSESIGWSFP
jgi:hypothetical protein